MNRAKKLVLILLAVVVAASLFTLCACIGGGSDGNGGDGNNGKEKSFTISCDTVMKAGERVEITITKSYDFPMNHSDYKFSVVGDNTVGGTFEFEDLDKNDNYTNKFFRAKYPGTVQIQATNSTSGLLTSNIVTITVTADEIKTVDDLKALANNDKVWALGADIDLSSERDWTPIEGFKGTLVGNGHSIKNLTAKVRSNDNVGLFGELLGTVNGVKLENVNITGSGSGNNVGAIAGKSSGTIDNCQVSGTINCEYATKVGGIVGYTTKPNNITNNVNNANVTSYEKVGGIVGNIVVNGSLTFKSNTNNGAISGTNYVGGIVGVFQSVQPSSKGTSTATISDCENNGAVTASGDYAGGIAGQATGIYVSDWGDYYVYLEISDCENNGEVTGKDYTAGIYGYGGNYVRSVTACVNTADITGHKYVGGYIGYSSNTATQNMNNSNKITGKGYVGGIAGYTGNVQNCKNNGEIVSTGTVLEDSVNKYCLGGIAGYCTGAVNNVNNVDITLELAGKRVGGIAGSILCNGSIENNTNSGEISAPMCDEVGGIAGRVRFTGARTVSGNTNEKDVSGASYVGGFGGLLESVQPSSKGSHTTTISDCANEGNVTASGNYAGGIAGQATGIYVSDWGDYYVYLEISDCENNGEVKGGNYTAGIYGNGGTLVRSVTACVNTKDIVGGDFTGGYVGYSANTTVQNMNNNKSVTGKGYVGGIAGYAGVVKNCKNNGTVTSTGTILESSINKYCVGGIAGFCSGAINCTNNVDITLDLAGRYVGGIAGYVYGSGSIESNTNSGEITALLSDYVGGIAGRAQFNGSRTVKSNTNEAAVSAAAYVGGIAGALDSVKPSSKGTYTTAISECVNNGAVTGTGSNVGGITGYAAGMYISDWGDFYVYLEFSSNTNNAAVTGGSSSTRAAIVGKVGSYVNKNTSLWSSNSDNGSVGNLYN